MATIYDTCGAVSHDKRHVLSELYPQRPNVTLFSIFLMSCFPGMLLRYFLNGSQMVPFATITTGIASVFTFHVRRISVVRSLYIEVFSVFCLDRISVS